MGKNRLSDKPLVLLDRDGTLIEECEYLSDPREIRLLPGVPEGLRRLKRAGIRVVVVSNQSGVGRGIISLKQFHQVNRRFLQLLKRKKAPVDGLYCCPHIPSDRCACRKPKVGLVKRAAKHLKMSWKGSISVGDRPSDVELGQKTGGAGVLVLTGYGRRWAQAKKVPVPDHKATDFRQAVSWILKRVRNDDDLERK